MIILLSPAKTMDFSEISPSIASSEPRGYEDAEFLAKQLSQLSQSQLKALLKVNDGIASENFQRIKSWGTQPKKQCLYSYNGAAYHGLQAHDFGEGDRAFAQQHLRILSGMYGLLRPLDLIQPYRLEMGCKLETEAAANLYKYWQEKLVQWLKKDLAALPEEQRLVINCASQEYSKALDFKELAVPVIEVAFPGYAMLSKPARGAMARYIIKQRITSANGLKDFKGNKDEWHFDPDQSSDAKIVFLKQAAASKATAAQKRKLSPSKANSGKKETSKRKK